MQSGEVEDHSHNCCGAEEKKVKSGTRKETHRAEQIGRRDRGQAEHAPGAPAECSKQIDEVRIRQLILHFVRHADPLEHPMLKERIFPRFHRKYLRPLEVR